MRQRRRIDPLLAGGVVLLLIVVALTAITPRPDDANHGLTASVYDEGPGGAATLRRLIEGVGLRTVTLEGETFRPDIGSARVVFMLGPAELVTGAEIDAIRSYLRAGGVVVLASDFTPFLTPLLEAFDVRVGSTTVARTRLSGALFAAPPAREIEVVRGRELRLGAAWEAIGTDGSAPTVAMRVEGKGLLIVTGSVIPFVTDGIDRADNARFAVALAAVSRGISGGPIAFDEYHHGVHPPPTIFAVVQRTWPGRALLLALVLLFGYVASLEYVRGFAGLVRRAGRQEIVRDRARRELHAGLARRAGLDPATPFAQVVERLGDVAPGRAEEAALLDAQLRRRLREAELVRTVARVATLLHEEAS